MLSDHRRALHRIPELDWVLPETAAYLRAQLSALPCKVFSPCGDAVCAFFDFGKTETVAFRSDMDALPVTERTELPFASAHAGKMHACGHDGHMAVLLGLASYLAGQTDCKRNVLLIFQPAEETTGGAGAICATGLLPQYHVACIYGIHLWPGLAKHTVASCAGPMMARAAQLRVEVRGRSVHLAHWREGNDALAAAADFLRRVYAVAEQAPCILRFGRMESGTAPNTVSESTVLEGSLRCYDDGLFAHLTQSLFEAAAAVETATACRFTVTKSDGYRAVSNDAALLAQAKKRFPIADAAPTYITEDFSEYQRHVPGVFFRLGTGDGAALHSPRFDFDEAVLETGLSLLKTLL